jgi:selenide, water dikinase
VLVGPETWDDAGVYRLNAREALVQTVDFFTPVVDSPRDYGAIAAANALSDVYAMGGRPITALGLLGMPEHGVPDGAVGEIFRGGEAMLRRAGVALLGGHSVKDRELKFGYAVTGLIHPRRIVSNDRAKPGDVLVLTKPLGTGVLTTALKRGQLGRAELRRVTRQMCRLNEGAAHAMLAAGARAATDISGYGLLGHARNVALASRVTLEFFAREVPILPGVMERIGAGCYPGGLTANLEFVAPLTRFDAGVPEAVRKALCDPQTSGGLLISIGERRLSALLAGLKAHRVPQVRVIGRVLARGRRPLVVS